MRRCSKVKIDLCLDNIKIQEVQSHLINYNSIFKYQCSDDQLASNFTLNLDNILVDDNILQLKKYHYVIYEDGIKIKLCQIPHPNIINNKMVFILGEYKKYDNNKNYDMFISCSKANSELLTDLGLLNGQSETAKELKELLIKSFVYLLNFKGYKLQITNGI